MESVLLDDWVLTRVFRHLKVQELIQSAVLVCHKWKNVALFEFHRNIPPPLFRILQDGYSATNSPLRRYHSIFEQNLLRDCTYEALRSEGYLPMDWWVTKGFPWALLTQSRQLCTRTSMDGRADVASVFFRFMGR